MFFVYTGILFSYLLITIILPLPAPVYLKVCLGLLLLAGTQLHYVSRKISGMMIANYPKPLLYAWEYLFAFAVILFLISLPVNLTKAFTWLFSLNTIFEAVNSTSAQYGLIGISALLSLYSFYQGNKVPSVKRKTIILKNWPNALNGFTIAQLSDLHVSNLLTQKWLSSVVSQTNALNPDLIVITGDFTDGFPSMYAENIKPLKTLSAHHGVYGCLGNHDYYYDYDGWTKEYRKNGINLLINEHVEISRQGHSFILAGVADPAAKAHHQSPPDIKKAIGYVESKAIILLDHRPDSIYENAKAGVDLQLSGHTHGGMMPLLAQIVKKANKGFNSGHYFVEDAQLYLSNGTGIWNGFPLRLGYPAEITLLTIKNK